MEKLLHEKLRRLASKGRYIDVDDIDEEILGVSDRGYDNCSSQLKAALADLADVIEKYYMPRPRFEDGEPVRFGDEVIGEWFGWDENGEVIRETIGEAHTFIYHENGRIELCITDEDGDSIAIRASEEGDYFKRPAPKVLDADGVEINVGDTVWSVQNGKQAVVSAIGQFETEYSKGNVMFEGFSECYEGTLFTHKEPDSLEKLLETIKEIANEDNDFRSIEYRLAALIERGE